MKGRLIAIVGIFCIGMLIVSGQYAQGGKPDKPDKPDKPGGGNPSVELVTLVGDLTGEQLVVNGFPNAGPFPPFLMTLSDVFDIPHDDYSGTRDGLLFAKPVTIRYKGNRNTSFMVQWCTPTVGEGFRIEVRGGDIYETESGGTMAEFHEADCDIYEGDNVLVGTVKVSFSITLEPQ
jgi:hypothetical protein